MIVGYRTVNYNVFMGLLENLKTFYAVQPQIIKYNMDT